MPQTYSIVISERKIRDKKDPQKVTDFKQTVTKQKGENGDYIIIAASCTGSTVHQESVTFNIEEAKKLRDALNQILP
jgi:hypothetical protein